MLKIKGLAEVVLQVHDLEKAVQFYRDVLGLQVISPPGSRAVFLQAGPATVTCPQQIVLSPLKEGTPEFPKERFLRPIHHIGFEISDEDFATAAQRLRESGLEVRTGEHPFLPLKGLYVDDPDGNEVEFIAAR